MFSVPVASRCRCRRYADNRPPTGWPMLRHHADSPGSARARARRPRRRPGHRAASRSRFAHDANVHQRNGAPARTRRTARHPHRRPRRIQQTKRQDRTGLGQAISGIHIHAAIQRSLRQALGQRRPPMTTFQRSGPPHLQRAGYQHMQQRRHAMRERHAFTLNQAQQDVRLIAPWIDLLHAEHRGDIGEAQAWTWNIGVIACTRRYVRSSLHRRSTEGGCSRERVQHQLAMAEITPLGCPVVRWCRKSSHACSRRNPELMIGSPPPAASRSRFQTAEDNPATRHRTAARNAAPFPVGRENSPATAGSPHAQTAHRRVHG